MVTTYTEFPVKQAYTNRYVFFWVFTQKVVVICYRRFRKTYLSHTQSSRIQVLLDYLRLRTGTMDVPKRRCEIVATRCVMTQKNAVRIYFNAEALSHVKFT